MTCAICPESGTATMVRIIPTPDNNQGLVIPCLEGQDLGRCPLGRVYVCIFDLGEVSE